jgi:hypothetical protein
MKNSNDTIGNQTRDLPTCSAVPQRTALPRAPYNLLNILYFSGFLGTTKLKGKKFYVLPSECMYVFVWISEQTTIISLHSVDWFL